MKFTAKHYKPGVVWRTLARNPRYTGWGNWIIAAGPAQYQPDKNKPVTTFFDPSYNRGTESPAFENEFDTKHLRKYAFPLSPEQTRFLFDTHAIVRDLKAKLEVEWAKVVAENPGNGLFPADVLKEVTALEKAIVTAITALEDLKPEEW